MRVLALADAGSRTGFERVARNVLSYLHGTGQYDVTQMGILYRGQPGIEYPYKVYPFGNDSDPLGVWDLQEAIKTHKPDVLWIFQDVWNISKYASLKPINVPLAVYFPIDTPNLKWQWGLSLGAAASVATYTTFGAQEAAASVQDGLNLIREGVQAQDAARMGDERSWFLMPHPATGSKLPARMDRLAQYQNPSAYHVIPHGQERGLFGERDRSACRAKFGIPAQAFVVLNVNTNQFRKRQDLTLRAFRLVAAQRPDAFLVLHCAGPTTQGWDLEQLVRYYGLEGRVLLVHQQIDELSEDDLVSLYNTADVQINTGGGEGWGLTAFEGAACGIPQMVPDWSATRELWADHGVLIPVRDYRAEPKYLNTMHAVVDVRALADDLLELADSTPWRQELRQKALERAASLPTWEDVGEQVGQLLIDAVSESSVQPVSLEEVFRQRTGTVRSEIQDWPETLLAL